MLGVHVVMLALKPRLCRAAPRKTNMLRANFRFSDRLHFPFEGNTAPPSKKNEKLDKTNTPYMTPSCQLASFGAQPALNTNHSPTRFSHVLWEKQVGSPLFCGSGASFGSVKETPQGTPESILGVQNPCCDTQELTFVQNIAHLLRLS